VDTTNKPGWWGELAKDEVLEVKEDALIGNQGLNQNVWIATGSYGAGEKVSVAKFKANPSHYAQFGIYLLNRGTRVQCVKLERYFSLEYSQYKAYVKVLDGECEGKCTTIPVIGDVRKRGSMRLNAAFLGRRGPEH